MVTSPGRGACLGYDHDHDHGWEGRDMQFRCASLGHGWASDLPRLDAEKGLFEMEICI